MNAKSTNIIAVFICSMFVNSLNAQCNIIGKQWQRINDDGDTISISIEKKSIIYYINGRELAPSNGAEIDKLEWVDDEFLNHNIKDTLYNIKRDIEYAIYSKKIGLHNSMSFRFIDCNTLQIKDNKSNKESVFYNDLGLAQ